MEDQHLKQARTKARASTLQMELDRIVRTLADRYDPVQIILYGSLAHGRVHEWSDLDICIVKETDQPFFARLEEVARLTTPRVGTEFVVYTPHEFESAKSQRHYWIADEILGKGRTVFLKEGGMPANWLAFAREDYSVAEVLVQSGHHAIACFHCQQAVEKVLKAFLLHKGQIPPHIHLLTDLLNQCVGFENTLSVYGGDCAVLDQYYILPRYPDAAAAQPGALPDEPTARRMLDVARTILTDLESRILPAPGDGVAVGP